MSEHELVVADSVKAFWKEAKGILHKDLIARLRLSKDGIFLRDEDTEVIIQTFERWLTEHAGDARSDAKIKRRLFGTEELKLWYLVEGKNCLLGHLVPWKATQAEAPGIPLYQGSLQDPADLLHPRDPILQSTPGLRAELSAQGLILEIERRDQRIKLPVDSFQRFVRIARHSRTLKRSGLSLTSQRQALAVLVELVRRAKPVRRNRSVIIPARIRRSRDVQILSVGSLLLLIENSVLTYWYETRGGNLIAFVDEEIAEIYRTMRGKNIGALQIPSSEKMPLMLRSNDDRFKLLKHAALPFIQHVLRRRPHGASQSRATLLDCLKELAGIFSRTFWLPPQDLPPPFRQYAKEYPRIRRFEEWYFFIDKTNAVRLCAHHRARLNKPLSTTPIRVQRPQG